MKQKLFRTSIEQTGAAVFKAGDKEKIIPLFSNNPLNEARSITIGDYQLEHIFYTNNLLDYKIEDLIRDFINENKFLPEDYMEELVSGFPFIMGISKNYCFCYK